MSEAVSTEELWNELSATLVPLFQEYRGRLGDLAVTRKRDRSLLTEADTAIQEHIVSQIRRFDASPKFLAEEQGTAGRPGALVRGGWDGRLWVIDPIDGTREFLDADGREFCSVVCLLEDLRPVAALVVAPELGPGDGDVCVRVGGEGEPVMVNGDEAQRSPWMAVEKRASVTRSDTVPRRPFEDRLISNGWELKTRTTSQTLDLVRTCVDLSSYTEARLRPFSLFYREAQKMWDGAAGLCLARTVGLQAIDRSGRDQIPIDPKNLQGEDPSFDATIVASSSLSSWFLTLLDDG
jgi:3'(2'), 5'-bisphosphate nucleotidase